MNSILFIMLAIGCNVTCLHRELIWLILEDIYNFEAFNFSADSLFFYGTVFAGGVVMATGFVHILPDAADDMSNPCLGLSATYPWAYVIAGAASLLTFMAEYFLKQIIRRYRSSSSILPLKLSIKTMKSITDSNHESVP